MASHRRQCRRQTTAVLVRMLPEEKAQLDELVPRGEVGPLIRRLLVEHLADARATQPALIARPDSREETTTAA